MVNPLSTEVVSVPALKVTTDPWCVVPPMLFGALALILGVYLPPGMQRLLQQAAALFGGTSL